MKRYRYQLEKYTGSNTRFTCPKCNKNKVFTRYIDNETGKHLHSSVGKCNREVKCGYDFRPKEYFNLNKDRSVQVQPKAYPMQVPLRPPKPISYIPFDVFQRTLLLTTTTSGISKHNHLVKFMIDRVGAHATTNVTGKYYVGTSKRWEGASVFYGVDLQGRIRQGRIMKYNPDTGRKDKQFISSVHYELKLPEPRPKMCFFGEHLLVDKSKVVAIVESEKSAIIADVYIPDLIWIASGGLSNLTPERCEVLRGRTVVLCPDLGCYDKWVVKARSLRNIADFTIYDGLEQDGVSTDVERVKGCDIADILLKFDYGALQGQNPIPSITGCSMESESHNDKVHFKIAGNELTEIEKCILENFNVVEVKSSTFKPVAIKDYSGYQYIHN